MFGFSKADKLGSAFDREYSTICLEDDRRLVGAAGLLSIVNTGVHLDIDNISGILADVAEYYGVDPDAIQLALEHNEPPLGRYINL